MIASRSRRVVLMLAIVALTLFGISRLPPHVDGVAALGTCAIDRGWPVVLLDSGAERYLPVARWPSGLHFDLATGELGDASGRTVLRSGDRVLVTGSIVDVHGDPSPCYFTRGIEIDSIASSSARLGAPPAADDRFVRETARRPGARRRPAAPALLHRGP
jgi:hypothetical protein